MTGRRRPSPAHRHLPPVNGEKRTGRTPGPHFAMPAIGEGTGESVLLPVTMRGEVPGRAMRGGANVQKADRL